MLLRSTKKFFHKTIQSFKSLFSGNEYAKLPKTTPTHNFSTFSRNAGGDIDSAYQSSNYDVERLDKLYVDYTNKWDSSSGNPDRGKGSKKIVSSSTRKDDKDISKFRKQNAGKNTNMQLHGGRVKGRVRQEDFSFNSYTKSVRDGRISLVAQKLKEMVMLDTRNAEHAQDIEEVFHYYSRLTCPAYLDIVDKFFMEVYTEFSSSLSTPSRGYSSKLKQKAWRP